MYSRSSLVGLVSSKRMLQRPPYSFGQAEVEADGLGVPDMEVSVGLGRESGLDPPLKAARLQVVLEDGPEEVQ